jgi:hypothetical protein
MRRWPAILVAMLLAVAALHACAGKQSWDHFLTGMVDTMYSALDYLQIGDPVQAPYVAQRSLTRGMINSLRACEHTLSAAKLDKEAQKYGLLRKKIDNDPAFLSNTGNLKYTLQQVDLAVAASDKVAASRKFDQSRAREHLCNGLFFASLALSNDVLAVKAFETILKKKTPDNAAYGGSDQARQQFVLYLAEQGMNYLPRHIESLGRMSSNISSYATDHDIVMPSKAEIRKAEDAEKAKIDKGDL